MTNSIIELDLSFEDLIAMPENSNWYYSRYNGVKPFTPAEFVTIALQKLGVFGETEINAAEFTVRDVYTLNIYEQEEPMPDACILADF